MEILPLVDKMSYFSSGSAAVWPWFFLLLLIKKEQRS